MYIYIYMYIYVYMYICFIYIYIYMINYYWICQEKGAMKIASRDFKQRLPVLHKKFPQVLYIYIYIYIYRERERCIYIYIYIYHISHITYHISHITYHISHITLYIVLCYVMLLYHIVVYHIIMLYHMFKIATNFIRMDSNGDCWLEWHEFVTFCVQDRFKFYYYVHVYWY